MNLVLPLWVLHFGASGVGSASAPAELARFSAHWFVRFSPIPVHAPSPSTEALESERSATEQIEAWFDEAQGALGALAPREAGQALTRAERLILAHPELPQAAWLLAECHRLHAELVAAQDRAAARRRAEQAFALEGPRAAPFREATSPDIDAGPATAARLDVLGLGPNDRLEWDAEARTAPLRTSTGQHQLRVLRNDRLVWASWVSVDAPNDELSLNLPLAAPCSADDLGATLDGERGPSAPAGVRCPEWAVARPRRAGLELALCRGSRCGEWHRAPRERSSFEPPAQVLARGAFPGWTSYAIVGVGAAAAAAAVLLEAGIFAAGERPRERWRYDGLR